MIGNAVPVPLIAAVCKEVLNAIEGSAPGSGVDEMVLKLLMEASKQPEEVDRLWYKSINGE